MSYPVLIALHAVAGVVAFAAGWAALVRDRFLLVYQWALLATVGLLALAVAVTAAGRSPGNWGMTAALLLLGVVMVARALRASAVRPGRLGARTPEYVHRAGFGVVGLFDAFWVVAVLRAGLPGWAVVGVGAGIAVGGHLLLVRVARTSSHSVPA